MDVKAKWISIVALLLSATAASASSENDIKDAAKGFALALSKGDAVQAKKYATSDETTTLMIDTLSPLIAANQNLRAAAAARFGQAGAATIVKDAPGQMMDDWARLTDSAVVKIDGEAATISEKQNDKPNPANPTTRPQESPPLKLKLENHAWKVDFSAMPDAAALKQNAPLITALAKAMNDIADEIKIGKFAAAKDAKAALDQKQAVISAQRARGRGR
jgi:hypothetical protein